MKKIGFTGVFDKTDLMLNISKILATAKQKVLIVDSTIMQKARYIVPVIEEEESYITTFEDIDIAVGFDGIEELRSYLKSKGENLDDYHVLLIDADTNKVFTDFDLKNADINFFVTSFDLYSLRKGLEVLNELEVQLPMTKILFVNDIFNEEDEYLSYLTAKVYIEWAEERIFFQNNLGDQKTIIENQRVQKVKFSNLSSDYKDSLVMIVQKILGTKNIAELKKVVRIIEKGV